MLERLERIVQEKIRPQLAEHGGDIRILSFEDGVVRFNFLGQCMGCPSAELTTKGLIQAVLTKEMPEIREIILEEPVDEELLRQARAILGY